MSKLQPGQMLGPYQIVSQVGQGGMATVYKAFQAAMNRYVAVKVLPEPLAENQEFIARFKQEAQIIANLEHPRILPVFDYGESGGHMYMVMRFLDTGTLKEKLTHALSLPDIDHWLVQLVDALGYAHARNVVHRDLKPSNVLVDAQANLFLTDFGVAKLLESQAQLTNSGALMGTPAYMSPEQAQGLAIDQRSDIYSLGVILYEMLIGRVPYEAETPLAVILKHINEPLPPPSMFLPAIAPEVERVLLKALAKNPDERYASCAELLDDWRQALPSAREYTQPAKADTARLTSDQDVPASAPPPAGRRDWLAAAGVGGIGLVGLCLLAVAVGALAWLFNGYASRLTIQRGNAATAAVEPLATLSAAPGASAAPTHFNAPTVTPAKPTLPPAILPAPTALNVEIVNLSNNETESAWPHLMVGAQGVAGFFWQDETEDGEYVLLYRQRFAAGEWGAAAALTENTAPPVNQSARWVRQPAGDGCVVWQASLRWSMRCWQKDKWTVAEQVPTESTVWDTDFAFGLDGKLRQASQAMVNSKFMYEGRLVATASDMADFVLRLDAAGNPHLVWADGLTEKVLKHAYSPDGGKAWQVTQLSPADSPLSGLSIFDLAATQDGAMHVVWHGEMFAPAMYRRWTTAEGWGEPVPLPGGTPGVSLRLFVDAQDRLHAAADGRVGQQPGLMYFAQQADQTWSPALLIVPVEDEMAQLRDVQLAVDTDGVRHFAYALEGDVFYTTFRP